MAQEWPTRGAQNPAQRSRSGQGHLRPVSRLPPSCMSSRTRWIRSRQAPLSCESRRTCITSCISRTVPLRWCARATLRSSPDNRIHGRFLGQSARRRWVQGLPRWRTFPRHGVRLPFGPDASAVFTRPPPLLIPRPLDAAHVTSFPPAPQSMPPRRGTRGPQREVRFLRMMKRNK